MVRILEKRGGNGRQRAGCAPTREARKQAQSFAMARHWLPETFHGKEGVDGSIAPKGSATLLHIGAFLISSICIISSMHQVWRRLWSSQISDAARPRLARAEVRR